MLTVKPEYTLKTKPAPGPWWVVVGCAGGPGVVTHRTGSDPERSMKQGWGCSVVTLIGDHTDERTRGNELATAHLISASHELYGALEQAITSMLDSGYSLESVVIKQAQAAMAKADGKAQSYPMPLQPSIHTTGVNPYQRAAADGGLKNGKVHQ